MALQNVRSLLITLLLCLESLSSSNLVVLKCVTEHTLLPPDMMESVYPFPHHGIGHMIHQRQSAPPSLVPPGVVPNFVNPDTIGNRVTVASITLIVFASIFVAIRLLIKWRVLKKWSWDDGK